jgi:hypothetical protein
MSKIIRACRGNSTGTSRALARGKLIHARGGARPGAGRPPNAKIPDFDPATLDPIVVLRAIAGSSLATPSQRTTACKVLLANGAAPAPAPEPPPEHSEMSVASARAIALLSDQSMH